MKINNMKENNDIYNIAENIKNKKDFENFIKNFLNNLNNNPEEWENNNLYNFLDGFYGYVISQEENINWNKLAEILLASRVYE